jgi:hypothetical protein
MSDLSRYLIFYIKASLIIHLLITTELNFYDLPI